MKTTKPQKMPMASKSPLHMMIIMAGNPSKADKGKQGNPFTKIPEDSRKNEGEKASKSLDGKGDMKGKASQKSGGSKKVVQKITNKKPRGGATFGSSLGKKD